MTSIIPLSALSQQGLAQLKAVAAEPDTMRYVRLGTPWPAAFVDQLVALDADCTETRERWQWAIADTEAGDVVGYVALSASGDPEFPGLQIRIFVGRDHLRRGHASRAVLLACSELARARSITVFSFVHPSNTPSLALFARLGFQDTAKMKRFGDVLDMAFSKSFGPRMQ